MIKFNKYINELLAEGDLNKMRSFICRNSNTCEECPLKNDDCKDNSVLKEFFLWNAGTKKLKKKKSVVIAVTISEKAKTMGRILFGIFLFFICSLYLYGFVRDTYLNWKHGHNDEEE